MLAEIRTLRPWTDEEATLADGIVQRVTRQNPTTTDASFFDGLVSAIGTATALGSDGAGAAVDRLIALSTSDGWPQTIIAGPRYRPGARVTDLTLWTATPGRASTTGGLPIRDE